MKSRPAFLASFVEWASSREIIGRGVLIEKIDVLLQDTYNLISI